MGLLSKDRDRHVLKLVHPGGFVELHHSPIMASQVMNKNPRHYVTPPDFFHFPSIVVSPQSILTPGNVFFIVPCHTIRRLLKSQKQSSPSPTTKNTQPSLKLKASSTFTHSELKPCLKKDNARSRRNLKVTFMGNDHRVNFPTHSYTVS